MQSAREQENAVGPIKASCPSWRFRDQIVSSQRLEEPCNSPRATIVLKNKNKTKKGINES